MKLRNKKTGEIGEAYWATFREDGADLCISMHRNGAYVEVNSLAELNEGWEDYKPKEPLIKDTECREIMRLWADRCGVKTVRIFGSEFRYGAKSICFGDDFGLEHLKLYTIEELCGTPPEPIEPTFVDLDERVKEKEEK